VARSAEAARRIRARQLKRRRGTPEGFDHSWHQYRNCDLCGKPYVTNNYADHKPRLLRWKGYIICATCRYKVLPAIKKLVDERVLKYRKQKGND